MQHIKSPDGGSGRGIFSTEFFVRTRRQIGLIAKAMWWIEGTVRKKDASRDVAEFIGTSSRCFSMNHQNIFQQKGILENMANV
jgi:hypothetical protein